MGSFSAFGEYRVYQYEVFPAYPEIKNEAYTVTSFLDPISFLAYRGGNGSLKLHLLRTWMCRGYTGAYKSVCLSPAKEFSSTTQVEEEP